LDRWLAVRAFIRVVETGSLSAAARSLKVGQPAVSKAVAALERHLGSQLLLRSTRRTVVTEAGSRYYEVAKPAFDSLEEAEQITRGNASGIVGVLRVAAPVTFGRLHVVPALGPFLDANPRLQLEFVLDDRSVDVVEERIDVALRVGAIRQASLIARRLSTAPRLVVASPAYLARRGTPSTPGDLLAHDVVIYTQRDGGNEWTFRSGTANTSVRIPERLSMTAAEGVRAAVLAGLGLTIASRWMFGPELASGAVLAVLTEYQLDPIDLWAVLPSRRAPARARAFIDFVQRTHVRASEPARE
jgi:DNA-binding transcriptional LysR family regulator